MLISAAVAVTPVRSVGAIEMFAEPLNDCPAIFRAVARVVAVLALPLSEAVMVPALKSPLASRATIAEAVFALVAVVAEFDTLPAVEMVASFVSTIPADALMSPLTIVPSAIFTEVTAPSAIFCSVTAEPPISFVPTESSLNIACEIVLFGSDTVPVNVGELSGAYALRSDVKATVPVASGKVTVRSAVTSAVVTNISYSLAVAPSRVIPPERYTLANETASVVPTA